MHTCIDIIFKIEKKSKSENSENYRKKHLQVIYVRMYKYKYKYKHKYNHKH